MKRIARSKSARVTALIVVAVAGIGFIGWRAMQPKIRTATAAEVRAMLPPELLQEIPSNVAAVDRYKRLGALSKSFDPKVLNSIFDYKAAPATRSAAAYRFWQAKPHLLSDVASLLESGPLQCPPVNPNGLTLFPELATLKSISKVLAAGAHTYAEHGDSSTTLRMLSLGIKLGDRLLDSNGPLIDYLVAVALEAIANKAVTDAVSTGAISPSDCKQLLSQITPSARRDDYLYKCIRTDFQEFLLTMLPDPSKWNSEIMVSNPGDEPKDREAVVGTYDAIDTTKTVGQILKAALKNARSPLSQFDGAAEGLIEREAKGLPDENGFDKAEGFAKTFYKFKYKFLMNNSRNTIGRKILANGILAGNAEVDASDKWRANRDLVRALLASRIYRASHNGQLPSSPSGFVPLLGAWPTDPFNGKPMIYKPEKEIAYSVGTNLIDDGGQISDGWKSKDVGIWLKK